MTFNQYDLGVGYYREMLITKNFIPFPQFPVIFILHICSWFISIKPEIEDKFP